MMLIVGILAFVLFGLLPAGAWASAWIAGSFGIPELAAFAGLFVGFVLLSLALIRAATATLPKDTLPHEDRPAELGLKRSEGYAASLVLCCAVVGAFAAVLILPMHELPRVTASLVALALAVIPGMPLVRSTWPPRLEPYVAPEGVEPTAPPPEEAQRADIVMRTYAWTYQDSVAPDTAASRVGHHIAVPLRRSVYDDYRARPREHTSDAALAKFVHEGITDEVRTCAALIAQEAAGRQLSRLDAVSFVLAFSHDSIPYAHDHIVRGCGDYANYPIETLYEQRGDCEDHAILTAALLIEMGLDACLVIVSMPDGSGHAAVGVHSELQVDGCYLDHNGRRYYYCEATPAGDWRFGEIPPEYLGNAVKLSLVPIRTERSA